MPVGPGAAVLEYTFKMARALIALVMNVIAMPIMPRGRVLRMGLLTLGSVPLVRSAGMEPCHVARMSTGWLSVMLPMFVAKVVSPVPAGVLTFRLHQVPKVAP